jgi:hypothetical protein
MAISRVLGSSALLPAGLGFRNKIINGGMAISQRGTSAISNAGQVNTYGTDRWHAYGSATSKMTITQSTTNPTGQGFSNSTLITSSAATTPDSGHFYGVRQYIEGSNMADLAWGTSGAKPIVVSFWVRSSIAGTYSFALFNSGNNRALISTYTISAVDTWEKKTIYINAGETTGTWETGNGIGTSVWFDLGSGTAANGTANVWNTSLLTRTSGSVNWIGTSGATFYLTGVQLEQNLQPTPFEQRPIGVELQLCQRYFTRLVDPAGNGTGSATYLVARCSYYLPIEMRTIPNLTTGGTFSFFNGASTSSSSTVLASFRSKTCVEIDWAGTPYGSAQSVKSYTSNGGTNYIDCSSEL